MDSESTRSWITAAAATVGAGIALVTYVRNSKVRREEQARLVYAKITDIRLYAEGELYEMLPNGSQQGVGNAPWSPVAHAPDGTPIRPVIHAIALAPIMQSTVIVHNGSKELIGPLKIQIVNTGLQQRMDDFSAIINAVEPESDAAITFTWINSVAPGLPGIAPTLLFRDSSGQWWRRTNVDKVQRVHNDPENTSPTPAELARAAQNAEKLGIQPQPDNAKIPMEVKLHRLLRKFRGKDPLP